MNLTLVSVVPLAMFLENLSQCLLTWSGKIKLFEPSEGIFRDPTWTTKKFCKIGPLEINDRDSTVYFKDIGNCLEKVKNISHLKPHQLEPSIYIMKELCFFSLDQ